MFLFVQLRDLLESEGGKCRQAIVRPEWVLDTIEEEDDGDGDDGGGDGQSEQASQLPSTSAPQVAGGADSQPSGLRDFPGTERVMAAGGGESRTPLTRTSSATAPPLPVSMSTSGARPRTDRRAAGGDAPPPQPPVREMSQLSIVTPPPGLVQYVGVLFSMVSSRAVAHVRVRGILTAGMGVAHSAQGGSISCYFGDVTMPIGRDPSSPATLAIAYLHGNTPPLLPAGRLRFSAEFQDRQMTLQFAAGPAELNAEFF